MKLEDLSGLKGQSGYIQEASKIVVDPSVQLIVATVSFHHQK